jgi:hypothetical protein
MRLLLLFLLPFSVFGQIKSDLPTTKPYLEQLTNLRANRPVVILPTKKYFLFGMNTRKRIVYENGTLTDLGTGQKIKSWFVKKDTILAEQYAVELETVDGRKVRIEENEKEIFYDDSRFKISLSESPVYFPSFNNKKFEFVLKVIYQEILLNINQDKIYADFLAKSPASYKDIALLAMVLEKTRNSAMLSPYLKLLKLPDLSKLDPQEIGALLYLFSLKGSANQLEVGQLISHTKIKNGSNLDSKNLNWKIASILITNQTQQYLHFGWILPPKICLMIQFSKPI